MDVAPAITNNDASSSFEDLRIPFGQWLIERGLLIEDKLNQALAAQKKLGKPLGEVLITLNILSSEVVTKSLSEYLGIPYDTLNDLSLIDIELGRKLPEAVAKRFCLIPLKEEGGKVVVAMHDPLDIIAIDTISRKLDKPVRAVIATAANIQRTIEAVYHGSDIHEKQLRDLVSLASEDSEIVVEDVPDPQDLEADARDAPVIRFVDLLLMQAVKSRASDIHIEPGPKRMSIRMRVDGVLQDMVPPPHTMQAAVVTRIKILGQMDIAERRLPQDGRFGIKPGGQEIDVRVSVMPTIYGEKAVLRILNKNAISLDLGSMGLEPELYETLTKILDQPHGIVIVTGPTGSGKSTTLYSALNHVKDPTKNISTVEDPVEYRMEGINQTQIRSNIGLTFSSCLRTLLRQDPDVILVGEIRDKETMEIAMKASLTGHLVLSTFHTNDAVSSISRLRYMGLEPYMIATTLNLIVAQRLVRRICEQCREPIELPEKLLRRLNIDPKAEDSTFYHGKGCPACNGTGYHGRMPIFEFFVLNDRLRRMILDGATESQLRDAARQAGYGGLLESGLARARKGLTTAEEVIGTAFVEAE
jgi:type IV pilus assembly protein PilB